MELYEGKLLQIRAEIHAIRCMMRLLEMGETDVDFVDGCQLAESAEIRINEIFEMMSGVNHIKSYRE